MLQRKRRIAFVHGIFPFGGAERVTLDIAAYLTRYNYEIFVFSPHYDAHLLSEEQRQIPLQVIALPDKKLHSDTNTAFLIRYIQDLQIDILLSVVRVLERIDIIKQKTCVRYIYYCHSQPFWEVILKINNALKRREKNIWTYLEWFFLSYPKYCLLKLPYRFFYKQALRCYTFSDAYLVLCAAYKEELVVKLRLNPSDNKIRVIPNTEKSVSSVCWEKRKQFLFVGRLTYADKRIDRLIRIWAKIYRQLPEWELILVGDGVERKHLEQQAQGLDRVRFEGFSNKVSEYYREASVLCLVSEVESWGLCLTEAQAHGVIPVAFACSAGVQEILSPSGEHGFLVPPYDLDAYARTLLALAHKPESELLLLRQKVVEKAASYSMDQIGPKWLALLDELYA